MKLETIIAAGAVAAAAYVLVTASRRLQGEPRTYYAGYAPGTLTGGAGESLTPSGYVVPIAYPGTMD